MTNNCINIAKDGDLRDEKVLVDLFTENYMNTVGMSSGKKREIVKIVNRTIPLFRKLYQNTVLILGFKKPRWMNFC